MWSFFIRPSPCLSSSHVWDRWFHRIIEKLPSFNLLSRFEILSIGMGRRAGCKQQTRSAKTTRIRQCINTVQLLGLPRIRILYSHNIRKLLETMTTIEDSSRYDFCCTAASVQGRAYVLCHKLQNLLLLLLLLRS